MIIAVLDDDPHLLNALGRLLSSAGYGTELFASAEKYLEAASTSKADCLLVDMQLGTLTGLDVMRRLSAAGLKLPVICMSGSADATFRTEALCLGCTAYLQKPFVPELLIATIRRAVRNHPRTDSEE
jgi:FixJ family two-component response regulator